MLGLGLGDSLGKPGAPFLGVGLLDLEILVENGAIANHWRHVVTPKS